MIDGEHLSHLRFADDILICSNTPHELQQMVEELVDLLYDLTYFQAKMCR